MVRRAWWGSWAQQDKREKGSAGVGEGVQGRGCREEPR